MSRAARPPSPWGGRSRLAVTLLVLAALPVVVGGAAPAGAQQQPTTTTTQAPTTAAPTTATTQAPTTQAPTTRPPATTATTAATTTSTEATTTTTTEAAGDDSVDWGLIALIAGIALVVILLVALIAGAASRRRRTQGMLRRRIAQVVGGAEWVHDQASLDLMGATQSPERLRAGWDDTRRRINNLGSEATAIAVDADDEALAHELRTLSHSLGLLAGALDTSVGLRLQGGDAPGARAAIDESFVTVSERRYELEAALAPLARRV